MKKIESKMDYYTFKSSIKYICVITFPFSYFLAIDFKEKFGFIQVLGT